MRIIYNWLSGTVNFKEWWSKETSKAINSFKRLQKFWKSLYKTSNVYGYAMTKDRSQKMSKYTKEWLETNNENKLSQNKNKKRKS